METSLNKQAAGPRLAASSGRASAQDPSSSAEPGAWGHCQRLPSTERRTSWAPRGSCAPGGPCGPRAGRAAAQRVWPAGRGLLKTVLSRKLPAKANPAPWLRRSDAVAPAEGDNRRSSVGGSPDRPAPLTSSSVLQERVPGGRGRASSASQVSASRTSRSQGALEASMS